MLTGRAGRALRRLRSVNQKKYSQKLQVRPNYRHTTKRNKKNKFNTSAIRSLSVGVACCPQTQRGEKMEEKVPLTSIVGNSYYKLNIRSVTGFGASSLENAEKNGFTNDM